MEMNVHSNKKLSEVPLKDIFVGMDVLSPVGGPGKVSDIVGPAFANNGHYIEVKWFQGKIFFNDHRFIDHIKVK